MTGCCCVPRVEVLTRNSLPTLPPTASYTCALIEASVSPPVPLKSLHAMTKPPFASPLTVGAVCRLLVWVLTRNSLPALLPLASYLCALMAPSGSPPNPLVSAQVMTKPPSANPATEGNCCEFAIEVLTRNSSPTLLPPASNSCALIDAPLASPPSPLVSSQAITKPPFASAVIVRSSWSPVVAVLTRISPPTLTALASNTCALTDTPLASPPRRLSSSQLTTKPPLASAVTFEWF